MFEKIDWFLRTYAWVGTWVAAGTWALVCVLAVLNKIATKPEERREGDAILQMWISPKDARVLYGVIEGLWESYDGTRLEKEVNESVLLERLMRQLDKI